jgi:hypothetical protein
VADLFFYGLISSPLNETPRLIAFIMGAMHGINAAVLFAISCHVIRPIGAFERWTLTAVAWLIGVSGAGFVSLVGTTTNDLTSSLFVLGALLGVLKVAGPRNERAARLGFAGSGLLAGIGIGLKYTSAIYIPGLGAVALLVAIRRRKVGGLIAFGGGALVGFRLRDITCSSFGTISEIQHFPTSIRSFIRRTGNLRQFGMHDSCRKTSCSSSPTRFIGRQSIPISWRSRLSATGAALSLMWRWRLDSRRSL